MQEAFAAGKLKPGLNKAEETPKTYANNVKAMRQKIVEFAQTLPWLETLEFVNEQAPLAPEMAAQLLVHEQKRENQLKNNKKLPQIAAEQDPVLNDFKREMMFHRQAQACVLEAYPKLKALGLPTKRPDDYFAEMAKSDEHMQKIRQKLMQKQAEQQRSERVKQLRANRKEGKALQIQAKLQRESEKKQMLDQVKKVRKGISKDLSFLDGKPKQQGPKKLSKRAIEKKNMKEKKFGFGGKKRGSKLNTRDSAEDISEYKRQGRPGKPGKPGMKGGRGKMQNKRPGKNRRANMNNRKKSKK